MIRVWVKVTGQALEKSLKITARKKWPIARYAFGLLRKYEASQLKIISPRNQNGPFKKCLFSHPEPLFLPLQKRWKEGSLNPDVKATHLHSTEKRS